MDFYEDDSTSQQPPRPPRRPRRNRRRTRIQRLATLAAIVFVLVFLLAWGIMSCQRNAKENAYRSYFSNVNSAIATSENLGKKLNKFVTYPTRKSNSELKKALSDLCNRQQEVVIRVKSLNPPGKLSEENSIFVRGMIVRQQGFTLFRKALLADISQKKTPSATTITSLSGYFTGPDAYYNALVFRQAKQTMQADGVTNVAVPEMTYFAEKSDLFSKTSVTTMLTAMRQSGHVSGVHGVALVSVVAMPGNTKLVAGTTDNTITASADLNFKVTVQNSGSADEVNVPVTVTLALAGQSSQKFTATIAAIAKGQTQSVNVTGFQVPSSAISHSTTLTVMAGPVPGETVLSNNKGQYKIFFSL